MFAHLKLWGLLIAICCLAIGPMVGTASAVTVEVAKKCEALTAKAFPPRVPGNPAAGSTKGSGIAQQDYFKKCVERESNTDNNDATKSK